LPNENVYKVQQQKQQLGDFAHVRAYFNTNKPNGKAGKSEVSPEAKIIFASLIYIYIQLKRKHIAGGSQPWGFCSCATWTARALHAAGRGTGQTTGRPKRKSNGSRKAKSARKNNIEIKSGEKLSHI